MADWDTARPQEEVYVIVVGNPLMLNYPKVGLTIHSIGRIGYIDIRLAECRHDLKATPEIQRRVADYLFPHSPSHTPNSLAYQASVASMNSANSFFSRVLDRF